MVNDLERLIDEVTRDTANPEVPGDLAERVLVRVWAERAADVEVARPARVLRFDTTARVREGRSLRSTGFAVVMHAAAILLIALLVRSGVRITAPVRTAVVELPMTPPLAPPKSQTMGGGGGQKGPTPVSKGTPPKFAERQIVPPSKPPLIEPPLKIEPTVEVQPDLRMPSSLAQIGLPVAATAASVSVGNGSGTGLGSGDGPGIGPGSGGNTGNGPRHVGGGVSAPVALYMPIPEFTDEARRAKLSGNVLIGLWVETDGRPSHVHVVRSLGMGLDETAVAAVKQYRFRPAMENGRPVLVEVNIEVNFRIF